MLNEDERRASRPSSRTAPSVAIIRGWESSSNSIKIWNLPLTTHTQSRLRAYVIGLLVAVAFLGGCASVTAPANPRDPLEPLNRGIYSFNEHVDGLVLKPAAELYRLLLPPIARTGVSNFFSNINDVLVALNNLLQGKVQNAASDVGRVAVNSTIGVLGFIDVATKMGLEKHDEDFGQTLGYWGVGDGPYLVLPFFGPSNFRDAIGRIPDYYADPVTYVDPSHDRNILWGIRIVNRRAELLGASRVLEAAALDPYEFVRDAYLQRRRNLIYDGNPPREDFDDEKDEKNEKDGKKPQARAPQRPGPTISRAMQGMEEPVYSVLVSGEPLTPAEEEAQRAQAPLPPASSTTLAAAVK